MKKKLNLTLLAISLMAILVLSLFLIILYSENAINSIIPSNEPLTQASLLSQDSESATYSYSNVLQGSVPDMQCQDAHLEEIIDFDGGSHPYSESSLPCLVEGLQINTDFPTYDVAISLPIVQDKAPCNGQVNQTYLAVYEDTGTTCSVGSGAFIGCRLAHVSCHFRGKVKAYDSNGQQVPATFGWVTSFSAKVQALQTGIVCLDGWEQCNGMSYSVCSNNEWVSQGFVDEKCGYQTCIENWQCSDFTACNNGQQTRICTDDNNCGTEIIKPPLFKECNPNTHLLFLIIGIILIISFGAIIVFLIIKKIRKRR